MVSLEIGSLVMVFFVQLNEQKAKSDFQYFVFLSSELFDDKLKCSICTEFFKDPVSTSCGNTYCSSCITKYRAQSEHRESGCPKCGKTSGSCSVLHTNIVVAELVKKITPAQHSPAEAMETGGVEPRLCKAHYKALVMFCKTDQATICKECAVKEHREHDKQYIKVNRIFLSYIILNSTFHTISGLVPQMIHSRHRPLYIPLQINN